MTRALYIAATGQNVGKTAVCLGLFSKLLKTYKRVGFIKPVGQRHVELEGAQVDKDVALFKCHFQLKEAAIDMSPVVFTRGYTKEALDSSKTSKELEKQILSAFKKLSKSCDVILIEGTGHMGVGSVAGVSCARVAKLLNAETYLVSKGGIGSSLDEITLNEALLKAEGGYLSGVILNKVFEEKLPEIKRYVEKGLKARGIPLLGTVPYAPFLSTPTMHDYAFLFKTPLIAGESKRFCHFTDRLLALGPVMDVQKQQKRNQLIITSTGREDIVMALLATSQTNPDNGLILTGNEPPKPSLIQLLEKNSIPTLYVNTPSYFALEKITAFVTKFQHEDSVKTLAAIEAIEGHLDRVILCPKSKKKLS
jgi:phosphate acetyltransferase